MQKIKTSVSSWCAGIIVFFVAMVFIVSIGCDNHSGNNASLTIATLASVQHPVTQELALQGAIITQVSTGEEPDYDAIILDCNSVSPEMISSQIDIVNYHHHRKGLILLNATKEHRQALSNLIGISVGDHTSRAYFIGCKSNFLGKAYKLIDSSQFVRASLQNISTHSDDPDSLPPQIDNSAYEATQTQSNEYIDSIVAPRLFAQRVANFIQEEKTGSTEYRSNDISGDSGYLKKISWEIGATDSLREYYWALDTAWVWYGPNISWRYPAFDDPYLDIFMKGIQTGGFGHSTIVTVYLENSPSAPEGNKEYITVEHTGWANPAQGSTVSDGTPLPLHGKEYNTYNCSANKYTGYGYGQMRYTFDFAPDASRSNDFFYVQGEPANKITNETHHDGFDFGVEFSKEGISASAEISHEVVTEVPDWEVNVNSNQSQRHFSWDWRTNDPGYSSSSDISSMNDLNLKTFQPEALCVLDTVGLITDSVLFNCSYGVRRVTMAAYKHKHYRFDQDFDPIDLSCTINFGLLQYPVLQGIAISPTSVSAGSTATGTVTLDVNAPANGVDVALSSSNTAWATVPETVHVNAGTRSQSFTITTLKTSGNPTVNIKAQINSTSQNANLTVVGN